MVAQNGKSIEIGNPFPTRQRIKTKQKQAKNEPTIVCMRKSQHGTQNVKTHNRRTQNTKKMGNTDLNER